MGLNDNVTLCLENSTKAIDGHVTHSPLVAKHMRIRTGAWGYFAHTPARKGKILIYEIRGTSGLNTISSKRSVCSTCELPLHFTKLDPSQLPLRLASTCPDLYPQS